MSEGKDRKLWIASVLFASLLSAALSVTLLTHFYRQEQYRMLDMACQEMEMEHPESLQTMLEFLKEYKTHPDEMRQGGLLSRYGYQTSDLLRSAAGQGAGFAGIGFLLSGSMFLWICWYWNRRQEQRLRSITEYLEQVNKGEAKVSFPEGEDDGARLRDEIYKTVTYANQTRDEALKARSSFARNLSNIAHQLKTPITSISLSVQMLRGQGARQDTKQDADRYLYQIERQLARLTALEESLLLLSRIDAGTLPLEQKRVDVFTLLSLAADNLQELCSRAEVSIEVPELGEAAFVGDLDWTMEAVMNLMKNCVEHSPVGGRVNTFYEQNPLYTQIRIQDQGRGFSRQDLSRLFERFYRGEGAGEGGIGIGLSLAREIIERQNGIVRAENLPEGGACFEIRFYFRECHETVTFDQ